MQGIPGIEDNLIGGDMNELVSSNRTFRKIQKKKPGWR